MIETTMQNLVIKGRIPSKKNSKRVFRRNGRTILVSSLQHEKWHREAWLQLKEQKARAMVDSVSVKMNFWFPDNRKTDLTNKAESVMDLLVDMGVIKDDNVKICPKVSLEFCGIDKNDARVEIGLEKI